MKKIKLIFTILVFLFKLSYAKDIKLSENSNLFSVTSKSISEFTGPVVFSNKITSSSPRGIEATNLFLQGDSTVSRKYTVGLGTPSLSGNPGDLVFNANPVDGGNAGWIYTLSNEWRSFGTVSLTTDTKEGLFGRVGIGTTTAGNDRLKILGGTDQFSVDSIGHVGIGTSANGYALNVTGGDVFIDDDFVIGAGLTISSVVLDNSFNSKRGLCISNNFLDSLNAKQVENPDLVSALYRIFILCAWLIFDLFKILYLELLNLYTFDIIILLVMIIVIIIII